VSKASAFSGLLLVFTGASCTSSGQDALAQPGRPAIAAVAADALAVDAVSMTLEPSDAGPVCWPPADRDRCLGWPFSPFRMLLVPIGAANCAAANPASAQQQLKVVSLTQ
jgi:hypothetical protein